MNLNIKNKPFSINVVHKREDLSNGMMGKTFDEFDGMLFLMPEKGAQSFWMKNCIVPLDIIFIDRDKITNIAHNCPPCTEDDCPTYNGYGGFVLELPGGTCKELGIDVGDYVDYDI